MTEYNYYADPDNRAAGGPARRRTAKQLTTHVPVRFSPELIAEAKLLATDDRKTVSSWIRDLVEAEVERRRPRIPETTGLLIVPPTTTWTTPEGVRVESEAATYGSSRRAIGGTCT